MKRDELFVLFPCVSITHPVFFMLVHLITVRPDSTRLDQVASAGKSKGKAKDLKAALAMLLASTSEGEDAVRYVVCDASLPSFFFPTASHLAVDNSTRCPRGSVSVMQYRSLYRYTSEFM